MAVLLARLRADLAAGTAAELFAAASAAAASAIAAPAAAAAAAASRATVEGKAATVLKRRRYREVFAFLRAVS